MSYIFDNPDVMLELLGEHLFLTLVSLTIATLIALPVGYFIFGKERLTTLVLGVLGMFYTIPSLVLMILLLPLLGLNAKTVMAALIIYCQIILVRNVLAGLGAIDPSVTEAARGIGMSRRQQFLWVQLPLALPVIVAGMRLAAVISTSIATIGALFGAGGLGTLLFNGISQNRPDKILAGSITVSLLAAFFNYSLQWAERRLNPLSEL